MYASPGEFQRLEQDESEARHALAAAREQHMLDDGEIPHEHRGLIRRLEDDWKKARDRLEGAKKS